MAIANKQKSAPAKVVVGEVWEQQDGEGAKAYAAFAHYRDTEPAKRGLRPTGRAMGNHESTIFDWSSRYSWVQRSRAYDAHLEKARLAELKDQQISASRRHAQTTQVQILSLGKLNEEVLQRMNNDEGFLKRLQDKTLVQLAIAAARATPRLIVAERLALGLSSENIAGHDGGAIAGTPAEDMSDAELDSFLMGATTAAEMAKTDPA